jgi:hypothetical protein
MGRVAWAALVGGLAACSPFEPAGDAPMAPPAEYRAWFAKTEACSGLTGDFDRIQWYSVDGDSFDCPSGKCVGRWNSDHHIYISSAYVRSELVVRHELLHELLGHRGHPDPRFVSPCPLTWESWRAAYGDSTLAGSAAAGRLVARALTEIV